jgi:hypothetical protein
MATLAARRRDWIKPYPDAIDQGHGSMRGTSNAVRGAVLAISGFFLSRNVNANKQMRRVQDIPARKPAHKPVTSERVEGYDFCGGRQSRICNNNAVENHGGQPDSG